MKWQLTNQDLSSGIQILLADLKWTVIKWTILGICHRGIQPRPKLYDRLVYTAWMDSSLDSTRQETNISMALFPLGGIKLFLILLVYKKSPFHHLVFIVLTKMLREIKNCELFFWKWSAPTVRPRWVHLYLSMLKACSFLKVYSSGWQLCWAFSLRFVPFLYYIHGSSRKKETCPACGWTKKSCCMWHYI